MDAQTSSERSESDWIVICGGRRAIALARLLRAPVVRERPDIILLGREVPEIPADLERVRAVTGDPTRREFLRRAEVSGARTAIVLADHGINRNPDANTLLVALAIEDLDSSVYTIVEVQDSNNIKHFDRTEVNETVCRSQLSELLLAQAALNHGISQVYRELVTYQTDGNEIYRIAVAGRWGSFREAFEGLVRQRIIPIGIRRKHRNLVNPKPDTTLREDDDLWVVAFEQPRS